MSSLDFTLHSKQGFALQSTATEILYGGAAGGGKSHFMRVASILWATEIPGLQIYLFRRKSIDLEKNHLEGPTGYRTLLADWEKAGRVKIVEGEIRFWNGSKIFLCHCKDEKDRFNYQGSEMHVLFIDELTHFTEVIYRFLRSRVRAPSALPVPEKYKGVFPRIFCGSNPGNIGHGWVKRAFIDNVEPNAVWRTPDSEGGFLRQYIPARLDDNPSLNKAEYERNLAGLGSPAIVRAMRDGDWSVVAGSYFPEFGDRHVLQPFKIPSSWTRFFGFDWGTYHPFAGLWAAISDGTEGPPDYEPHDIPSQSIVFYRELYGSSNGADQGVHMIAPDVAALILSKEAPNERVAYRVADPAIFKFDSGPPVSEQMLRAGLPFQRGDNNRVAGWDQVRTRMVGQYSHPRMYFFQNCVHCIRTIPELQHDEKKPEDLLSSGEDHLADVIRYMCMSRPYSKPGAKKAELRYMKDLSLNELWDIHENDKKDY